MNGTRLQAHEATTPVLPVHGEAEEASSDLAESLDWCGVKAAREGRHALATQLIGQAIMLMPGVARYHSHLGNMLRQQGQLREAITSLTRAALLEPTDFVTLWNLSGALSEYGMMDEAADAYRRALDHAPDLYAVQNELGNALRNHGLPDAAIACYRRAIALQPDVAEIHSNLGVVLQEQDALDAAIACHQRAIALNPKLAGAHINLGIALQKQDKADAAIGCYRRAIELRPDFAEAYNNLGIALNENGAADSACAAFEAALAIEPRRGVFHRMLASTGRVVPDSLPFRRLQALATELRSLPETDQLELHFAIGTMYAESGQLETAFPHFLEGNRLKRNRTVYDEAQSMAVFGRIKDVFTASMLRARSGCGTDSQVPIFIVGMPRSGSSLLEQILASHPNVHGGGELQDLPRLVRLLDSEIGAGPYPDWSARVTDERLTQLARAYLDALHARAPAAWHVVDKLPDNFLRIGLIHLAFPGARIIHVARDPIDTCLSCFSKLFTGSQPYTYDLAELGRYYCAYQGLMAHWRQVLPKDAMLDIRYEDLVSDLEGQARRLLSYCGIPWDDACLEFHKTSRSVRTASAAQVRQPLYASAVGRWHGLTELAAPLVNELSLIPAASECRATTSSATGTP